MAKESAFNKVPIPALNGYNCFACGTKNPIGLHMHFYQLNNNKLCSDVQLNKYLVGWEDIVHGGIISTLLDEVMGWCILCFRQVYFVTKEIKIRYLRPTKVKQVVTACAWIEQDLPKNQWFVKSKLTPKDHLNKTLAEGEGIYVAMPEKRLRFLDPDLKEDMHSLFIKMKSITTNIT